MAPTEFTIRSRKKSARSLFLAAFAAAAFLPGHALATRTLEAGLGHNLAVTSSGQVLAWGDNSYGALGNGTNVSSSVPVRSGTLTNVVAVSGGADLSVALRSDGTVWTWGAGPGLGTSSPEACGPRSAPCSKQPRQVLGLTNVIAISASGNVYSRGFVLALRSDGTVRAWGDNRFGQLGNGNTTAQTSPVAVAGLTGGTVVAIAAGDSHSVALKSDGTVWTWGSNFYGELGALSAPVCTGALPYGINQPLPTCRTTPGQVMLGINIAFTGVSAISTKGRHNLVLRTDGSVWAWGSNYYGQLGDGTTTDRATPFAVPGQTQVTAISAGFVHSLTVKQSGAYLAWGLNLNGRLGVASSSETCNQRSSGGFATTLIVDGPWSCRRSPSASNSANNVLSVVGGGAHSLTVRSGGAIVAVGSNDYGQLGFGSPTEDIPTPFVVDPAAFRGSPQGADPSGVSIGRPSTSGGLNVNTIEDGLLFEAQAVGTASPSQEVRVNNVLISPFNIVSITTSGDFRQTTNCGTTVVGGASCGVFITFSPTSPGARTGTLTVTTNLPSAPTASLTLRGTATGTSYGLTVSMLGAGSGTVTSSPAGITCSAGTCQAPFTSGTAVTLSPTASTGSEFTGWSGGVCTTGTNPCVVTMDAAKSVFATFSIVPSSYAMNVTRNGSGTGTVTSSPAGINCGSTCTATFNAGTAVTLTASAAGGSSFTGWSGAGCTSAGSCTVTMNATTNVTATFTSTSATPAPISGATNYTALWWNQVAEQGWGINFVHQGDVVFGTLFTYDATGAPMWLVMSAGRKVQGTTFTGELYRTTGPAFNAVPFTPITSANLTQVGMMSVTFTGPDAATLTYNVNAITVTKSIRRQVFDTRAANCVGEATLANRAALTNYQDLWWIAAESGWGINVTHQGTTIFATLFTYNAAGQGMWLVMSAGRRQGDGSFAGELYRTRGPAFDAQPWTGVTVTPVGSMSIRFANGSQATLNYTFGSHIVNKQIARQVFANPPTTCN